VSAALRLVLALLACAGVARADERVPSRLAPRLDTAEDQIVQRAFVPSHERRVGEVRILRRGDATVVQTLLYSKLLSRVVAEIRRKEQANWPGDPEAARYVAALERAQQTIWRRLPPPPHGGDRRQKLWIDFVLAPDAACIGIGAFEMQEEGGEVRVVRRETLALLEPARAYVERNQRLIAADSLGIEGPALDRLLGAAAAGRSTPARGARDGAGAGSP
jgi:hypothetical protein